MAEMPCWFNWGKDVSFRPGVRCVEGTYLEDQHDTQDGGDHAEYAQRKEKV